MSDDAKRGGEGRAVKGEAYRPEGQSQVLLRRRQIQVVKSRRLVFKVRASENAATAHGFIMNLAVLGRGL